MEFYYPSRRQDLLVGSFVTTLLISSVYWFGNGPHFIPITRTPQKPIVIDNNFHPIDDTPAPDVDDARVQKTVSEFSPPELPDVPQVLTPSSMPQQIEPPSPVVNLADPSRIPEHRGAGNGPGVFEPGSLDQVPLARVQIAPHYPHSMIQNPTNGQVTVDFIVAPDGSVRNATASWSTNRAFEEPAVDAVSKWKFRPGRKNGVAVFTRMQVPIEFSIDSP
jgi:protein TonB